MPKSKKWLRGDPDRPFPKDLDKLNELRKRMVSPTHEPLWFYRNRGTACPAQEQHALTYQTMENIEIMAEMGLHRPKRAHFFKGLGLKRERPFIDKTIAYAKELHDRGMLVSVYVGGTIFTDYFFKEVPEAIDWCRKDMNGLPVTYGHMQLQRWFPCLNNPGYLEYTKKVLDVAIDEIEADEIFFDNQILRYEPRSCRCDYCIEHFRSMIRRKYTLEECERRYGVAEYPDSMPPVWSQANPPWRLNVVHRPIVQDWIDHRVETVLDFYKTMADHVKARKPDTAVGLNIKGVHGHNRAFDHGVCHGGFSDVLDFSCIDGYNPGYRNGAVISEVRFWKSSHSSHISVVDGQSTELTAAENQVYGYRKKIEGHGWLGDFGNCTLFTPMTQFLRANQRLFHERTHLHDIAVLRSEPSTRYNCAKVHEQLMAFEQTLAVEKLPWGIIFDKQIDDIDKHRIIALPEIQALSDAWIERLDAFLKAGGGVIASGQAAGFNEWYRPRDPDHALTRWLGHPPEGRYEVANVGKGRFVYTPEWEVPPQSRWNFDDWFAVWRGNVMPVVDRATFNKAVSDATVGRPLTHQISGPDPIFAEAIASLDGADAGIDLHVINYDSDHTEAELIVRVGLPDGKSGAKVTLVDPHDENHRRWEVPVRIAQQRAEFMMQTPKVYALAQVEFS
ncbi:MAG: beta-galactosidase [Planctomycetes bacterium]|nr:beta-galactosidase [Planctomycetota bacterium]